MASFKESSALAVLPLRFEPSVLTPSTCTTTGAVVTLPSASVPNGRLSSLNDVTGPSSPSLAPVQDRVNTLANPEPRTLTTNDTSGQHRGSSSGGGIPRRPARWPANGGAG